MTKSKNPPKRGEYSVGKGKPPLHSRWPKGVSGNPGGKKKGAIDLGRAFEAALQRPIKVTIDGEKREISSLDAILMRLVESGLKGDMRAIITILERSPLLLRSADDQEAETSADDLAILQRVLAEREPKPPHKRRSKKDKSVGNEGAQLCSGDREGDNG
ncbi:DUF5681 domain-containing protein [Methylocystis sp. ATCC 49242]|uniref:DUF5681 domain-containing protein n=1 Tax=Methylocystis sp. ATCC 49242 TaxID=622637 RepID=UPI0001F886DE|nr:DUF5681 domain-containing protein [Methylocystis sp. ATCC 49242]